MSSQKLNRFAVCVQGTGFDTVVGKTYRILNDRVAQGLGCVRVIDDSGEDYLYPATWFVLIRVEKTSQRRLVAALRAAVSAA